MRTLKGQVCWVSNQVTLQSHDEDSMEGTGMFVLGQETLAGLGGRGGEGMNVRMKTNEGA